MGTLLRTQGVSISEVEGRVLCWLNDQVEEQQGATIFKATATKVGTIYVVLQRMEQKKLLASRQDTSYEYHGPLPRFWKITQLGKQVVAKIAQL